MPRRDSTAERKRMLRKRLAKAGRPKRNPQDRKELDRTMIPHISDMRKEGR